MKIIRVLSALFFVFIFLNFLSTILLPSDLLKTLPHFSLEKWERPHNSLLADPLFQFEPWRHYSKAKLAKGELPFWNDLNGAGVPFLATPHTQIFSPLNLFYYIFPVTFSLILIHVAKVILFSLFTYLYLKSLGIKAESAFLGSIFAVSGFMLLWLQWPQTNVYLLFPLLLYFSEKIRNGGKAVLVFTVAYFVGFLGGHPETLFLMFMVHFLYVFLRNKKMLRGVLVSVIFSLLLASFLVFPFLEYLINSSIFAQRTQDVSYHLIPLVGLLFNIYPFFLGAPHLLYYHPLPDTNFQEMLGGYVGIIAILLSLFAIRKRGVKNIIGVWLCIILVSFLFSYDIPVFSLIIQNSFINLSANHRLVAFFGFGFAVIGALGFEELLKIKKPILNTKIFLLIGLTLTIVLFLYILPENKQYSKYVNFLKYSIPFISLTVLTTFLFFARAVRLRYFFLVLLVFLQTFFFLSTYNTFTKSADYYPQTKVTEYLKNKKDVVLLEVGNPNMPPDINLIYGFGMAENNDALGVSSYDMEFEKAFPIKNNWGKVDQVDVESLMKFGVTHVLSDYDINLEKINIQNRLNERINLINSARITFSQERGNLSQIRFIAYNFNRLNNCFIDILIISENKTLSKTNFDCKDARDGMFYTIDVGNIILDSSKKYTIEFLPKNIERDSYIALGGYKDTPYLDLLFKENTLFKKILQEKSVYLFEIPKSKKIESEAKYTLVKNNSGKITLNVESNGDYLIMKRTFYPGWKASSNNQDLEIKKEGPFMKILLPKGKSVITFIYQPLSFYIGVFVSLSTLLALLIILSRSNLINNYISSIKAFQKFSFSGKIILSSIVLLVTTSIYICTTELFTYPFEFSNKGTVNWYSVMQYPKQQDYVFYFLAITLIPVVSFASILVAASLLKRKK